MVSAKAVLLAALVVGGLFVAANWEQPETEAAPAPAPAPEQCKTKNPVEYVQGLLGLAEPCELGLVEGGTGYDVAFVFDGSAYNTLGPAIQSTEKTTGNSQFVTYGDVQVVVQITDASGNLVYQGTHTRGEAGLLRVTVPDLPGAEIIHIVDGELGTTTHEVNAGGDAGL